MNQIHVIDQLASTNESLLQALDWQTRHHIENQRISESSDGFSIIPEQSSDILLPKEDCGTWEHPLSENRLSDIHWEDGDMLLALGQTDGKGQKGNHWESEYGKNLTFSILLFPEQLPASRFFQISQAVSLAVCELLDGFSDEFLKRKFICIKWPNDIYVGDRKIGGILIENRLIGNQIRYSVVGVGLNINQAVFRSDAPNPVSLKQLTGKEHSLPALAQDLQHLLMRHCRRLYGGPDGTACLQRAYFERLYRRKGFFPYADTEGRLFMAEIIAVDAQGYLNLRDDDGQTRRFAFKEVRFLTDKESV